MTTINKLRTRIQRREERLCADPCKHPVPNVDPKGPRETAEVLFVLRDPGKNGAQKSAIVSPFAKKANGDWANGGDGERDDSASKQRNAFRDTGNVLDPDVCLWWNAVPWVLTPGVDREPSDDEVERGTGDLRSLIELLPRLRVVVPMGVEARIACESLHGIERLSFLPYKHKHPGRESVEVRSKALHDVAAMLAAG